MIFSIYPLPFPLNYLLTCCHWIAVISYCICFVFLQDGFVAHFSESSQSQTMWKSLFTVGSICAAGLTLFALNKWKYCLLFSHPCCCCTLIVSALGPSLRTRLFFYPLLIHHFLPLLIKFINVGLLCSIFVSVFLTLIIIQVHTVCMYSCMFHILLHHNQPTNVTII